MTLSENFRIGQELFNQIENNNPSSSDTTYQDQIKDAISHFSKCQMEIPQYHPSMNPMAGRVARRQMNSSPSGANQQQRHPSSQSQTSSSSSPSKRKFPDNGFEQKESDNKRSSTSNNNSLE
ncbi:21449_t:CDS:2 [Entrophospora sp. SA101]|nr:21449_t:CDS:2 [Entrophospora sp. SA101]